MRLVLIDDHELLAQSLQVSLAAEGIQVTRVWAESRDELLRDARDAKPELILLDYDLGPKLGNALHLIKPLIELGGDVVMLTGVDDKIALAACVQAGAVGIIDKSISFDQLVNQVRRTLEHDTLMSAHEREEHLARLRTHRAARDEELRVFRRLTKREAEVLGDLMDGKSAETIARESVVSVATIRTQIRSILSKLGVNSQLAAVAHAQKVRWRSPQ